MSLSATTSENNRQLLGKAAISQVSVLAVGDWQKREFVAVTSEICDIESWQSAANVEAAYQHCLACDTPPELIVVAQSVVGEYLQSDIDRLSELAPLSRIVLVAGTWCEGELRTGSRLEGTLRLYWYEFSHWWSMAKQSLHAGLCPPWSQPLDNPQAGRYPSSSQSRPNLPTGPVIVEAADTSVFETIAAMLASVDVTTIRVKPGAQEQIPADLPANLSAGIWDGGQLSKQELDRLTSFCKLLQPYDAKVVVLLDFPRVEHITQARAAGAATVLAKPYLTNELLAAL